MLFIYKNFSEKVHRWQQSDKGICGTKRFRAPALWVDCMDQSSSSRHGTIPSPGMPCQPTLGHTMSKEENFVLLSHWDLRSFLPQPHWLSLPSFLIALSLASKLLLEKGDEETEKLADFYKEKLKQTTAPLRGYDFGNKFINGLTTIGVHEQ